MKLLHVIANNFKNFNDSFEIDFYHDRFIYRYKTIPRMVTCGYCSFQCCAQLISPARPLSMAWLVA